MSITRKTVGSPGPPKTLQQLCAKVVAQVLAKQRTSPTTITTKEQKFSLKDIKILPTEIKQNILDALATVPILRPYFLFILNEALYDVESLTIDASRYTQSPGLTDGDVPKVLAKMTNLQKLSFIKSKYLSQPKIESNKLTYIDLRNGKRSLNPIWINCPNLQVLRLNTASIVLYRTLVKLSTSSPLLKILDLSCTQDLFTFTFGITERVFFPYLEELDLHGCAVLGNLLVESTSLKVLNLGYCKAIQDDKVQATLDKCPNLERLELCGCIKLQNFEKKVYFFPKHVANGNNE